jgi:demethylmenaquinone methyltransferase/2-methoxy-6-polyprenyl-1,4-benzoquinol methylase
MAELHGDEKRRYVGTLFSNIAERYDLMNTLMTGGMHHRWRAKAAAHASHSNPGLALDVATGTGDLAIALAERRETTDVVGMDLLPRMLMRANAKVGQKIHLVLGDSLSLPFPDGLFSCVTSGFSLRNMPDLRASLLEMARVLKPGGRMVTLELVPQGGGIIRPLVHLYIHHLIPLMGRIIVGDAAAYTYLPRSIDRFLTPDGLLALLTEIGLDNVGCQTFNFGTVAIHWGVKR